ncbi:MAG: hypothetical protein JW939_05235 [Candidatus Thermoplasmatota archaeon]|nr:hypothetical protein [Candidatus Thermoplasmatota archaeon]
MKPADPLEPILYLVRHDRFPTRRSLEEFCIAVGLSKGKIIEKDASPPANWDPSRYEIWPMLELISYHKNPDMNGRTGIREFLYPHLVEGARTIGSMVVGVDDIIALKRLTSFFPR